MKIGIIGNGYVGNAKLLVSKDNNLFIYDINPKLCSPENLTLDGLKNCDIIFLCLC